MRRRTLLATSIATSIATPIATLLAGAAAAAEPAPISIVAAENFYADIAGQIGGPGVAVTAILSNPDEDPHLFEASPSVARAIAGAAIVIANGLGYDDWMGKLLAARGAAQPKSIVVADLLGRKAGANPHLWYAPATMPAVAEALATALTAIDQAHAADYAARLQAFQDSMAPLQARVAALHKRFAGLPITATEPVFGEMAAALGLVVRNVRFQLSVMNDTEPAASDIAAFEADLRHHRVHLLIYNVQATNTAAQRMQRLAKESGIPILGVSETEPAGTTYQRWMLETLAALETALAVAR